MADILLQNVTKQFPNGSMALRDLSFHAKDGELLVLLGPSGSGKTTALRVIAGLETPTSGSISIQGARVNEIPAHRRNLAFVFQRPALYPYLSVRDNLGFGYRLRHGGLLRSLLSRRRKNQPEEMTVRIEQVSKMLGLYQIMDRRPGQLSGGQQQLVALGRALVRQPLAYLLDEPMNSIDLPHRGELRHQLHLLQRAIRATMVLVTHDQTEAMALADRVIVLDDGVIQQAGTPSEVYEQPRNRFVAGFVGTSPMGFLTGMLESTDSGSLALVGQADDLMLRIPERACKPQTILWGKTVTLGIRPEAVCLGEGEVAWRQSANVARLCMRVVWSERIGHDWLVKLRRGTWELNSSQPASSTWSEGQEVEVFLDVSRSHWFDTASGCRLNGDPVKR